MTVDPESRNYIAPAHRPVLRRLPLHSPRMKLAFLRGISLADKCLLLFGGAIVLIVLVASAMPVLRMNALVHEGQREISRELVAVWERLDAEAVGGADPRPVEDPLAAHGGVAARRVPLEEALASDDPFLRRAAIAFQRDPGRDEFLTRDWSGLTWEYRYARAVRRDTPPRLVGMIVLDRRSVSATNLLALNGLYLFSAGTVVLLLALLVFYLITHRLILSPVRDLRAVAEGVRAGDMTIRAEIETGDEFEELARTFNDMVAEMQTVQEKLHAHNAALDMKVAELSQRNIALFEANKLKGEFLANVSHELRTPLNSIVGFAELLLDIARKDAEQGDETPDLAKRRRFLENIVRASRQLLDMITQLLEMAKLEAGRVELDIQPTSVRDVCEALAGLIHPLTERKQVEVRLEVADDLPVVHTDRPKLQQVAFNFLSNAVKFIDAPIPGQGPANGDVARAQQQRRVTIRAELLRGSQREDERVRISVIDTGPGIAPEDQERIFEKFTQGDASHTREYAGTGLGLAICRELAGLLQGEIQLVSEPGRGSMFSLILPVEFDRQRDQERKLEAAFRSTLAGRREWNESGP